jgi:hypothetical protein
MKTLDGNTKRVKGNFWRIIVPFWTCEAKIVFFMSLPHHHGKTTGKVWDVEDMGSDMPNNIEYTSQHCANFGVASFSYSFSSCSTCIVISFLYNICKFGQKRSFQSDNSSCKGFWSKGPKAFKKSNEQNLNYNELYVINVITTSTCLLVPSVLAFCFPNLPKKF